MLQLNVTGVHTEVDEKLQKYIARKIGGLEKYLSRRVRASAHADVKLKTDKAKDKNKAMCEIIVHLPQDTITIRETTLNMYAAVDISEEKLKHALRKYKELHDRPRLHRRVVGRLRRAESRSLQSLDAEL